jgi:hypothetical protein
LGTRLEQQWELGSNILWAAWPDLVHHNSSLQVPPHYAVPCSRLKADAMNMAGSFHSRPVD